MTGVKRIELALDGSPEFSSRQNLLSCGVFFCEVSFLDVRLMYRGASRWIRCEEEREDEVGTGKFNQENPEEEKAGKREHRAKKNQACNT